MKKTLQVLLDPQDYEQVKHLAEEDSSSDSAAGRKLIQIALRARRAATHAQEIE
ncbi:MAG TPA: hypothetical protein VKZ65_15905 [Glycomyces sp.]|nr:hypothetical protein [Glycomyces sp.]